LRELRLELDGTVVARFSLDRPTLVLKIGSGPDVDVRVDDSSVPRRYGEISWRDGRLVLAAAGRPPRVLRDGERIPIGRYVLVVALGTQPAAEATAADSTLEVEEGGVPFNLAKTIEVVPVEEEAGPAPPFHEADTGRDLRGPARPDSETYELARPPLPAAPLGRARGPGGGGGVGLDGTPSVQPFHEAPTTRRERPQGLASKPKVEVPPSPSDPTRKLEVLKRESPGAAAAPAPAGPQAKTSVAPAAAPFAPPGAPAFPVCPDAPTATVAALPKPLRATMTPPLQGPPAPAAAAAAAPAPPPPPTVRGAPAAEPAPERAAAAPAKSGSLLGGLGSLLTAAGAMGDREGRVAAPRGFDEVKEDRLVGGPAEVEVDDELRRRTTVRYWTQMNPQRIFPLLVVLSKESIRKVVIEGVAQVEGKQAFAIRKENPVVTIEPHLPGCLVTPAALDVDVTPRLVESRFFVAPIVEGRIEDARIDIRYQGRVIDTVPLRVRVTKQTVAKVSAAFGVVSPIFSQLVKFSGKGDLGLLEWVRGVGERVGGGTNLGWIVAGLAGLVAVVFYLWNRPREGEPVDHFFEFETPPPTGADPYIAALKARLLILGDADRRAIPLEKPVVAIGGDPGADVFLRDGSVAWRHAEIRFEGSAFKLVNAAGEGRVRVEDRPVRESALKEDQVLRFGDVLAYFAYERQDDKLDAPEERAALIRILSGLVPPAAAAISETLGDVARPVRAGLIALMAAGAIDPETWRRALQVRSEELSRRTVLT